MIDIDTLAKLTREPENLAIYLAGSGWALRGATDEDSLWTTPESDSAVQLLAPIGGESPSAIRRMGEVLDVLAALQTRRQEDVARDIASVRRDRLLLRTFPSTESGTAPLGDAITTASAARDLLAAAATNTDDVKTVLGSRKPERAVEYANSAAVSTAPGSFILVLEIDVEPSILLPEMIEHLSSPSEVLFPDPTPPFSRRATERVVQAAEAAALAAAAQRTSHVDPFEAAVQSGVSANFLEALSHLGGIINDDDDVDVKTGAFRSFELGYSWSRGRPSDLSPGTIHFGAEFAPVFASAAHSLRTRNPSRNATLTGPVIALKDDEDGGTIVIEAEVTEDDVTRIRPVRVPMSRDDYAMAIEAKAARRRVQVQGDLQRTRLLTLRPLRRITVINDRES